MNNVNKTLYIPLYGKSYVSKRGLFLEDKKAEEIWEAEGFSLAERTAFIGTSHELIGKDVYRR